MNKPNGGSVQDLTVRDWFAGRIAPTLIANPEGAAIIVEQARKAGVRPVDQLADAAYDIADALLRRRERQ